MLTTTSVEIDLVELKETFSLPEVTDSPEEQDDGESEISLEETFGVVELTGERWSNGAEELSSQGNEDEENSDIGTSNSKDGLEWNVIEGSALAVPCLSESDVCLRFWY